MGAASQSVSTSWLASKTSLFRLGLGPPQHDPSLGQGLPIHAGFRVPAHPTTFSSGGSDAGGEEHLDGRQRPKCEFPEGEVPCKGPSRASVVPLHAGDMLILLHSSATVRSCNPRYQPRARPGGNSAQGQSFSCPCDSAFPNTDIAWICAVVSSHYHLGETLGMK